MESKSGKWEWPRIGLGMRLSMYTLCDAHPILTVGFISGSSIKKSRGIIQDLEDRHCESKVYSTEQIRVWAHDTLMKQHASYDDPR